MIADTEKELGSLPSASKTNPPARPIDLANLEIQIKRSDGGFGVVGGESKLFPGGGPGWLFEHGKISREPRRARVYSLQPGKRPYEVLRTTIRAADPAVLTPNAEGPPPGGRY